MGDWNLFSLFTIYRIMEGRNTHAISIFDTVMPEEVDPVDFPEASQCEKVSHAGNLFYVYFNRNTLTYPEFKGLENVSHRVEEDGVYNYLIYRGKDGNFKMVFARHILGNELGSKHLYLYTYLLKENLTDEMRVYLAGEVKKEGEKIQINFQSGTYTLPYKESWKEEQVDEMAWFEELREKLFGVYIRGSRMEYHARSFLKDYVIPFKLEVYQTLRGMGIETLFFNDPVKCALYKIKVMIDKGMFISSTTARRLGRENKQRYLKMKDNGSYELSEEGEAFLADPVTLERMVQRGGGAGRSSQWRKRHTKRRKEKKDKKKKTARRRRGIRSLFGVI